MNSCRVCKKQIGHNDQHEYSEDVCSQQCEEILIGRKRWISATDGLPDENVYVLVCVPKGFIPVWFGYYDAEDGWCDASGNPMSDVEFWQLLPEPPKKLALIPMTLNPFELSQSASEVEIADAITFCNDAALPKTSLTIRRLAFERDALRQDVERLRAEVSHLLGVNREIAESTLSIGLRQTARINELQADAERWRHTRHRAEYICWRSGGYEYLATSEEADAAIDAARKA